MFQRGRPEQPIKCKQEVLKIFPAAKYASRFIPGAAMGLNRRIGAIMNGEARISGTFNCAWKCWEDCYYTRIHIYK